MGARVAAARSDFRLYVQAVSTRANPTVEEFMTQEPCTIDAGLSLDDAQDRMTANNIRHLIVTRGDELAGIVSSRDLALLTGMPGVVPAHTPVAAAMRKHVFVCDRESSLEAVALEMETHRYGCAVIVRDGVAIGIFTTTDALRALRQTLAGHPVDPAVIPTHAADVGERKKVERRVRVGDALYRANVYPPAVGLFATHRV